MRTSIEYILFPFHHHQRLRTWQHHAMNTCPASHETSTLSTVQPEVAKPEPFFPPSPLHLVYQTGSSILDSAPLLQAAFGLSSPMHGCSVYGFWDCERALVEDADRLVRSSCSIYNDPIAHSCCSLLNNPTKCWDDLTFQFGATAFVLMSSGTIHCYAETPDEANKLATRFANAYCKPQEPKPKKGGRFDLITASEEGIGTQTVTLEATTVLSEDDFRLHYGVNNWEWHQDLVVCLNGKQSGLVILEGPPGTGKTSYLRHLMGMLKASHRFYFIPTLNLDVISHPRFINFWTNQRKRHDDMQLVVILEDAESVLMTRRADNRDQVSTILNFTDGMMADFLRLQIICTINASTTEIDQALLRPGRLISHRVFRRLDPDQAAQLAQHLGRSLPAAQNYSLADVYSDPVSDIPAKPSIGFAA